MTAGFAKNFRRSPSVSGPYPATVRDVASLNSVFSGAFTDRYRKDGLVGVHVPNLSSAIWRFAIEDADGGAMLWRGERDEIVAFNMCHLSGTEGWMGPLAVTPSLQGHGIGKSVVTEGTRWLADHGAKVIGLETMPRTVDNIGFYSSLGYVPSYLTITITLDADYADNRIVQLGRLSESERNDLVTRCAELTHDISPGYDYTREINLTHALGLGDTLVLERGGTVDGFALCHTAPLVEGRGRDELRVLKLACRAESDVDVLATQLADYARRSGTRRVAIRMQGVYAALYAQLVRRGARVRWTDLRMTLADRPEPAHAGVILSNWEI
ncbi:MAG TPA: GNAT family N-acetyltransferase [Gemmatimonadaceae bacterium]|nr:GNAT family N-acetyltransferase [Gemmatimonadaceae bacterium]